MSIKSDLKRALAKLKQYREERSYDEKIEEKPTPSDQEILNAEGALGTSLPESYKLFLSQAGKCPLIFGEVFWVGSEGETYRNIVKVRQKEMSEGCLQEFLIPFYADGYGNYVCFDIREIKKREYSVVFWDHEEQLAKPSDNLEMVASNFAAWFLEEVEDHIQEDQDDGDD